MFQSLCIGTCSKMSVCVGARVNLIAYMYAYVNLCSCEMLAHFDNINNGGGGREIS